MMEIKIIFSGQFGVAELISEQVGRISFVATKEDALQALTKRN